MLIAKSLLAIGALLVFGGVGIGLYGLTQHPGDVPAAATLHRGECTAVVLSPSTAPGAAGSPEPTNPPSQQPSPDVATGPSTGETEVLVCNPAASSAGDGKGPFDEAGRIVLGWIPGGQRWLVFVAFGILLIAVGLAFLTSAGFVSIMTAVLTGRAAAPAAAGSAPADPGVATAQEPGDSNQ